MRLSTEQLPARSAPRPRRVLMTADCVGGVWTYALDLAGALAVAGVAVELAVMGRQPTPAQRAAALAIPGLRLHESEFRLEWMDDPWDDVGRSRDWLEGIAARCSPDIVHCNTYAHASMSWDMPCLLVGHSCVCSWWRAVKGEDAPASWDRYRAEVAAGLTGADLVVAPTRAMLRELAEHYGASSPVAVIPNSADADAFAPGSKEPVVLCAGRLWDEAKNIALLDRAAPRLPWSVEVAGDTARPGGAAGEVRHVRSLGRLERAGVAAAMARAGIYCHPARYEPFGLAVLEAALSGCALVLGDIPSLRENWDGAAGFVDPDDEEALIQAVRRLAGDAHLRRTCADAARLRARRFTRERQLAAYLDAYAALLAGRSHPSSAAPGAPQAGARCVS